jgi:hypothetical protein
MYAHFGEFGAAGPIAHADIFAIARGSKSRLAHNWRIARAQTADQFLERVFALAPHAGRLARTAVSRGGRHKRRRRATLRILD